VKSIASTQRRHHQPLQYRIERIRPLIERHQHLADEHRVAEERVLREHAPRDSNRQPTSHVARVRLLVGALRQARARLGEAPAAARRRARAASTSDDSARPG